MLKEIKKELGGRGMINKEDNFLEEYDKAFKHLKDQPIKLLEIGISVGGCLQMWAKYFSKGEITGIDITPECNRDFGDRIETFIGDQTDTKFLETLGDFDIIIDDGGHTMKQQITSFEYLFPKMKDGGIYIIEDLHTSYWGEFIDQDLTAIDYIKSLLDTINKRAISHSRSSMKDKAFPKFDIYSMHLTDSLCIIEKGKSKTTDY